MKIGIIGAGMIGGTLARRLVKLGHDVVIANSRGPETIRELAADVGATAVSVVEAARHGEVVIVTIPQRAVADLPKTLFAGVPRDVVVIDTGNYYPSRDGCIPAIDEGQPESAWVAEQLGRPVVKAFNNIYFQSLLDKATPSGTTGRIALPVAGDSPDARAKVLSLVDELGFDPIDAGSIEESWRQQPGTPCYANDLEAPRLKEALAAADRGRISEYRKAADDAVRAYFEALDRRIDLMTSSNSGETNEVSMLEQAEILRLSQVVLQAICSHDPGALEPILAPDFVLLGDSQRLDRRAFLEAVGSAGFVALDAAFESIDIELLGGVAVAAGVQRVEVDLPGGSRAVSRGAFTDIFVKDSGIWRLRLAHSTELL